MNKIKIAIILIATALLVVGAHIDTVRRENRSNKFYVESEEIHINAYRTDSQKYLFLPSFMDVDELVFSDALSDSDVSIMKSSKLSCIFIDTESGRLDKIYADKIYVLSSNLIFRRTKDLIDLYILKSIADINVEKINRIYKEKNRPLQDFSTLFYRKDEIEHAYSLLRRVTNKPPFNDVYECCLEIAKKFKNEL